MKTWFIDYNNEIHQYEVISFNLIKQEYLVEDISGDRFIIPFSRSYSTKREAIYCLLNMMKVNKKMLQQQIIILDYKIELLTKDMESGNG